MPLRPPRRTPSSTSRTKPCAGPAWPCGGSFLLAAVAASLCAGYGWGQSPSGADRFSAEQDETARARTPLSRIESVPAPVSRPTLALGDTPAVRTLYETALESMQDGAYEKATETLDAALHEARGDVYEVLYLMALAKYRLERFGEARMTAEFAASLRHGEADVHFLLGRLYERQGRRTRAIRQFRTATLAAERELNNPRVTAAWYRLGAALAEEAYFQAAAEAYERFDRAIWETHPEHRNDDEIAIVLHDHPHGAISLRIGLLERLGQREALLAATASATENQPDSAFLARLHARKLLENDRPDRALEFCRARLDDGPLFDALMRPALAAARASGRLDEWIREIEAAVGEGRWKQTAGRMARRLDEAGSHEHASKLWRALLRAAPQDANAAWGLAASLKSSGKLAEALEALIDFVRADPDNADVPPERLAAWMTTFEATDEFLEIVHAAGERGDRDFSTDFVLGAVAAAARQTQLAEQLFASAVNSRPGFALAHVTWGRLLLTQYRWEQAKQQASQALEHAPRLAAAHYVMAEAHSGLDENGDAEKAYKKALRFRPQDAAYALALARHYRRMGRAAALGAQRYFQQALSIDPSNGEAAESLIESYLAAGKFDVARAQLEQAEASDLSDDVLRRVRTAIRYARGPSAEQLLEELTRQHERFPKDWMTALKLAAAEWRMRQRPDDAHRVLQRVLALVPDSDQALEMFAGVQIDRLEYAQAIEAIEKLAARYPNRRALLIALTKTYQYDFQIDKSLAVLHRLLALATEDDERAALREKLLSVQMTFQDYDGALALVDTWLKDSPNDDVFGRYRLGVLRAAERWPDAVKLATKRLEATPADRSRRLEFVETCSRAGRYKEAERRVRAWLRGDSGDGPWAGKLVEILLKDKRPEEALNVVNDLTPPTPMAELEVGRMRARCYAASDRVDAAVEELDDLMAEIRGLRRERRTPMRYLLRAEIVNTLLEAQRYEEALRRCGEMLEQAPKNFARARVGALELKRAVVQAMGNDEEDAKVAEALLAIVPNDAGLNNDLGYNWVDAGLHLERATRMIRKAVVADPLNAAFLDSLGWAYYKAGDFAAARKYLGRTVRLAAGQDPVIYDHLGDADYRLGDEGSARQHWEKTLALLEDSTKESPDPRDVELTSAAREKLAALRKSKPPKVAPTAKEQE